MLCVLCDLREAVRELLRGGFGERVPRVEAAAAQFEKARLSVFDEETDSVWDCLVVVFRCQAA